MTKESITVRIHVAWWVWPYVHTLCFFCNLMGTVPDTDKLEKVLRRGIKIKRC